MQGHVKRWGSVHKPEGLARCCLLRSGDVEAHPCKAASVLSPVQLNRARCRTLQRAVGERTVRSTFGTIG